jgi:hypothetical protein
MARGKKQTPEQIVSLLRQVEVGVATGKTTAQASKEALITEQTYYRWRKEYGGLQVDQARRLKELEQENGKLKRLVTLSHEMVQVLFALPKTRRLQEAGTGIWFLKKLDLHHRSVSLLCLRSHVI